MLEILARSGPKFAPALKNLSMIHQGKTRDTFPALPGENDEEQLLVVATDRLSTHNIVHESTIPLKGEVLTALTVYWATHVLCRYGIPHHIVAFGRDIYEHLPGNRREYPDDLRFRAIIVRKLDMIPVEFVFRAYLAGSLWSKYYAHGVPNPYGVALGPELPIMAEFDSPVFTPTEKSETDDPLLAHTVQQQWPQAVHLAERVFRITRGHLRCAGLEQVDSKYEIGRAKNGSLIVADEFSTPDSSRFALKAHIKAGEEPQWYDKQIARNVAERIWGDGPKYPLAFPQTTIEQITDTYLEIFERTAGVDLPAFRHEYL